jgi:hypothetical protein
MKQPIGIPLLPALAGDVQELRMKFGSTNSASGVA